MSVSLTITNQACAGANQVWLASQLRRVLTLMKIREGEWTITVVGDRAMAELHKRTMNLATTTDVLTFDLSDGGTLELDTVICRDEAARRARELGHAIREELLLYAIHSLLHVQGYDDVKAKDAAEMHRREDEILLRLGVGAVYEKAAGGAEKTPGTARRSAKNQKKNARRRAGTVGGSRYKTS